MPGQIRPNKQLMKVLYRIMKTEKDSQQKNTKQPTEKQRREWATTYIRSNVR